MKKEIVQLAIRENEERELRTMRETEKRMEEVKWENQGCKYNVREENEKIITKLNKKNGDRVHNRHMFPN